MCYPLSDGKAWKKKYILTEDREDAPAKSHLSFIRKLDQFLDTWRERSLNLGDIRDQTLGMVFTEENLRETAERNEGLSLYQLEKLLNARIASRIRFLCTGKDENFRKEKLAEYEKIFRLIQT